MAHVLTMTAGTPDFGRRLPPSAVPPPESAQERFLRALRIRMVVTTAAFAVLLAHNRLLLHGEHFTYLLLILLNLLDNSLVYYLTYRGFLVGFLAYFRLGLDAYAITFLCHLTGSVSSVMPVAYIVVICATAFLAERKHTMFFAVSSCVAYEILLALEVTGVLAYAPLVSSLRIFPQQELLTIGTNAFFIPAFLIMTALLVSKLADQSAERERQLRLAHADLARASADLVSAQTHLARSEKLASLGTLVAGVAHELNNPLGFVQANLDTLENYADRLERLGAADDPAERARLAKELRIDLVREELPGLLADCREGARRCREIVENLKDFSRPALRHPREVLLEELVEKALRFVAVHLKSRISVSRAFGLNEAVRCYPGQLTQVLTNFLLNAAQAIEGQGEIIVETGRWEGHGEVYIRVYDSGKGIASEDIPRLFDPFFTTKEPGQGTGLGLAVSYGIVAEHGGRILVESTPGEGSTFTVVLPRQAPLKEESMR